MKSKLDVWMSLIMWETLSGNEPMTEARASTLLAEAATEWAYGRKTKLSKLFEQYLTMKALVVVEEPVDPTDKYNPLVG